MALTLIFLLSSIVTASILDKKKMRVASVAYIVMIVVMFVVLLLMLDVEPIRELMIKILGEWGYNATHEAFMDAISTPQYGVYTIAAIVLTFIVQGALLTLCPIHAIVHYFSQKKSVYQKFKKNYIKTVYEVYTLNISKPINLMYCRILN